MAMGLGFPDKKVMAELTAKMLLEVEAVRFMEDKPFIFTSGWASPVYIDCRRLISFPRVRQTLMDFGAATVFRNVGFEQFDTVVGGETAGIPFAACWMADRLMLPMQYVRKQAEGLWPERADRRTSGAGPARAAGREAGLTTRRWRKQDQLLQRASRRRRKGGAHLCHLLLRHLSQQREKILADLNIKRCIICALGGIVLEYAKDLWPVRSAQALRKSRNSSKRSRPGGRSEWRRRSHARRRVTGSSLASEYE